jgi:hypothetical protein
MATLVLAGASNPQNRTAVQRTLYTFLTPCIQGRLIQTLVQARERRFGVEERLQHTHEEVVAVFHIQAHGDAVEFPLRQVDICGLRVNFLLVKAPDATIRGNVNFHMGHTYHAQVCVHVKSSSS